MPGRRHLRLIAWLLVPMVLAVLARPAGAAPAGEAFTLPEAVRLLQQRGVLAAGPGVNLRLADPVTRAEMVDAVVRALGEEENTLLLAGTAVFPDTGDHWASGSIALAYTMGLIRGAPDGGFHPDQPMTGAEVLALMLRLVDREAEIQGPWPQGVVEAAGRVGVVPAQLNPAPWQDRPLPRGVAFYLLANTLTRVPVTPEGLTLAEQIDAQQAAARADADAGTAGSDDGAAGEPQDDPAADGQDAAAPTPVPEGEPFRIALVPERTRAVANGWSEVEIRVQVLNAADGPAAGGPFTIDLEAGAPEVAELETSQVQVAAGEEARVRLVSSAPGATGTVAVQAVLRENAGTAPGRGVGGAGGESPLSAAVRGYTVVRFEEATLWAVRLESLPATLTAGGPAVPLRAVALDQDGAPFRVSAPVTLRVHSSDPTVAEVEGSTLSISAGEWESSAASLQIRPVSLFGEAEIRGEVVGGGSRVEVLPAPVSVAPVGDVAGVRMRVWPEEAPADGVTPLLIQVERVDAEGEPVAGAAAPLEVTALRDDVEIVPLPDRGGVAFYAARSAAPGPVTFVAVVRDRPELGFADGVATFRAGPTTRVALRAADEELELGEEESTQVWAYLEDAAGNPVQNQGPALTVAVQATGQGGTLAGSQLVIPPGAHRSRSSLAFKAGEEPGTLRITGVASRGLTVTATQIAVVGTVATTPEPDPDPTPARRDTGTAATRLVAVPDLTSARAGDEVRFRVEVRDQEGQRVTDRDYAFQVQVLVDGEPYDGDPERLQVSLADQNPVDPRETPAFADVENAVVARTVGGVADLYLRYEGTGSVTLEPLGRSSTARAYDDTGMPGRAFSARHLDSEGAVVAYGPGQPAGVEVEITPNLGDPLKGYLKAASGRTGTVRVAVVDAYGNRLTGQTSAGVQVNPDGDGVSQLVNEAGQTVQGVALNLQDGEGRVQVRVQSSTPGEDTYVVEARAEGLTWSIPFTVTTVSGSPPQPEIASVRGDLTQEEGLVSAQDGTVEVELVSNPSFPMPAKVLFYVDGVRVGEDGPVELASPEPADRTVALDPVLLGRAGDHRLEVRLDNGAEISPLSGPVQVVYNQDGPDVQVAGAHIHWAAGQLVLHGSFDDDPETAIYPERLILRAGGTEYRFSPETQYHLSRNRLRLRLTPEEEELIAGAPGDVSLAAEPGWYLDEKGLEAAGFAEMAVAPVVQLTRAEYSPGNQTLTLVGAGLSAISRVNPRLITLVDGTGRTYTLTTSPFIVETGESRLRIVLTARDNEVLADPARLSAEDLRLEAEAGWGYDAEGYQVPAAAEVAVERAMGIEAAYYDARTGQLRLSISPGFLDQGGRVDATRLIFQEDDGSPSYQVTDLTGRETWMVDEESGEQQLVITLSGPDRDRINSAATFPARNAELRAADGWYTNPSGRKAPGTRGVPLRPWALAAEVAYHPETESLILLGEDMVGELDVRRLFLGGLPLEQAELIDKDEQRVALRLPTAVVTALAGRSDLQFEADVGWIRHANLYENRGVALSRVSISPEDGPALMAVDIYYHDGELVLNGKNLPVDPAEWDLGRLTLVRMDIADDTPLYALPLEGASFRSLHSTRAVLRLTDDQKAAFADPEQLGIPRVQLETADGWIQSTVYGVGKEVAHPVFPLAQVTEVTYEQKTGILTLTGHGLHSGQLRGEFVRLADGQGASLRLTDENMGISQRFDDEGMEQWVLQLTQDQREKLNLFAPGSWQMELESGWLFTGTGGWAPPYPAPIPVETIDR